MTSTGTDMHHKIMTHTTNLKLDLAAKYIIIVLLVLLQPKKGEEKTQKN